MVGSKVDGLAITIKDSINNNINLGLSTISNNINYGFNSIKSGVTSGLNQVESGISMLSNEINNIPTELQNTIVSPLLALSSEVQNDFNTIAHDLEGLTSLMKTSKKYPVVNPTNKTQMNLLLYEALALVVVIIIKKKKGGGFPISPMKFI